MTTYGLLLYGLITIAGLFGLGISVLALIPTAKDVWEALRS